MRSNNEVYIQFSNLVSSSTEKLEKSFNLIFNLRDLLWDYLKEQCHEDFAVLGQFCAKIATLRL